MIEQFIHLLKELLDMLDSRGGERVMCLVLFHAGIIMLYHGQPYGKDVSEAAFGALLLSMRSERTANGVVKPTPPVKGEVDVNPKN